MASPTVQAPFPQQIKPFDSSRFRMAQGEAVSGALGGVNNAFGQMFQNRKEFQEADDKKLMRKQEIDLNAEKLSNIKDDKEALKAVKEMAIEGIGRDIDESFSDPKERESVKAAYVKQINAQRDPISAASIGAAMKKRLITRANALDYGGNIPVKNNVESEEGPLLADFLDEPIQESDLLQPSEQAPTRFNRDGTEVVSQTKPIENDSGKFEFLKNPVKFNPSKGFNPYNLASEDETKSYVESINKDLERDANIKLNKILDVFEKETNVSKSSGESRKLSTSAGTELNKEAAIAYINRNIQELGMEDKYFADPSIIDAVVGRRYSSVKDQRASQAQEFGAQTDRITSERPVSQSGGSFTDPNKILSQEEKAIARFTKAKEDISKVMSSTANVSQLDIAFMKPENRKLAFGGSAKIIESKINDIVSSSIMKNLVKSTDGVIDQSVSRAIAEDLEMEGTLTTSAGKLLKENIRNPETLLSIINDIGSYNPKAHNELVDYYVETFGNEGAPNKFQKSGINEDELVRSIRESYQVPMNRSGAGTEQPVQESNKSVRNSLFK